MPGSGSGNTTTTMEPPSWQTPYIQDFLGQSQDWFQDRPIGGGEGGYTPGFGTVAPFDPLQTTGQEMVTGFAGGPGQDLASTALGATMTGLDPMSNPFLTAMSGNLGPQQAFLSGMMQPPGGGGLGPTPSPNAAIESMMSGTPNMDVYGPLYDQIAQSASKGFMEEIMPGIRSEAMMYGGYGDPRQTMTTGLAADRANENMLRSMERLTSQAASEALGQRATGAGLAANYGLGTRGLQEQIRASQAGEGLGAAGLYGNQFSDIYGNVMDTFGRSMALAPSMLGMGMIPGQAMMDVGGLRQTQEQAGMTDEFNRWMMEQQGPLQDLMAYGNMIGGNYGGTTSQPYYGPSTGQNMLMGGMMGGMMPGMFGTAGAAGAAPMLGGMGPMGWGLLGAGAMGLLS
jgi:hypothetical protein